MNDLLVDRILLLFTLQALIILATVFTFREAVTGLRTIIWSFTTKNYNLTSWTEVLPYSNNVSDAGKIIIWLKHFQNNLIYYLY